MASNWLSEDKTRISISIKKDTLADIDAIAEKIGSSRSVAINLLINFSIDGYKTALKLSDDQIGRIADSLLVK